MTQAVLPLAPRLPVLGRPEPDLEAVRRRSGVEYFDLPCREILNRSTAPHLPFGWTINPYRGCEFGCAYCYARYTHRFFDLGDWRDFERKIFVKRGAAEALRRRLRRSKLGGRAIAIGTATDPYQPAERHFRVTRSLLEAFLEAEGLQLSITTKSPLILRDLELLVRLDHRHALTVQITLTTVDPRLARRLEPQAPDPGARLRSIRRLSEEGIGVSVFCMPILPWINSAEGQLRALFEAAAEHGAFDVVASPLFLRPAARERFWPWLESEFPHLLKRYQTLYGKRDFLTDEQSDRLLGPFRALRLAHGFPRRLPGRG